MMVAEQVYRYPRRVTWLIEVLAAVVVALAALKFAQDLLRWLWATFGLDRTLVGRNALLVQLVGTVRGELDPAARLALTFLLPSLGTLALALLLALLLRNSLPTVRTSSRGLLVEFAGDWLPIPWVSLTTLKITEDVSGQRFVLLAEADKAHLTGWHRLYSFVYRLGLRRGFLISSWISNFDQLIKTVLDESDRVARTLDASKRTNVQESASSPFFRFLLSPAAFFSQRTKTEAPAPAGALPTAAVSARGSYPPRITALLHGGTLVLGALLCLRFVVMLLEFLALTFPDLRALAVFNRLTLRQAQVAAAWWLPVAGVLTLLLVGALLLAIRNLLPELEARPDGLAVRYSSGWKLVPWSRITALKVTEFSEDSQVVLIQARGGLPAWARLPSLLYDGSAAPAVLLTSALSNFEALIERVLLEVSQQRTTEARAPIIQADSSSTLLLLSLRASNTIDSLVAASRATDSAKTRDNRRLAQAARPMLALALAPALLLFCERALRQGLLPDAPMIITTVLFFAIGFLEWPLVALGAQMLDESTGGGEEGYRPFYLYPTIQLPRVLALLGAVLLTLLGVPALPVLLWFGALVWAFLLAAGLWEELYQWKGTQLIAGGLFPVVFQLLMLIAYLFAVR